MRRATVLWEAFVTRFEDAWDRHKKGRLTAEEAGELLGMSARHFRRLRARYEDAGVGWSARPAAGPGLGAARAGERAGADAPALSRGVCRFHREALPRGAAAAAQLYARLHGDAAGAAIGRAGDQGEAARPTPQEAAAAAAAGDAAVSRWLDASLDRRARP